MAFNAILANEDDTIAVAKKFATAIDQILGRSALVFLSGPLGAGKTTFSRGMLRAYGHKGAVKSPTFTIVEPYELAEGQVFHFDLYRLNDPEELEYLGMQDYLEGNHLCLIEWAERGIAFLPECDLNVLLSVETKGRKLVIEGHTQAGQAVCAALSKDC